MRSIFWFSVDSRRHSCWIWNIRFLTIKCSFLRAQFEFAYLLKTAQYSKRIGVHYSKENINKNYHSWWGSLFGYLLYKTSLLDLKNSFSFALPNLTLFTFWKRLSNRETKDHRGAQLQKRTSIEFPPLLMRSTFWFSFDSTLYLGHCW